jgi:hypothetical protein
MSASDFRLAPGHVSRNIESSSVWARRQARPDGFATSANTAFTA